MFPATMTDVSSPEAQFASELRRWLTTYGQHYAAAAQYVSVAYARGYLQQWPSEGAAGVTSADLNAIIDLMNEYSGELDDGDKTLINRLRTDI